MEIENTREANVEATIGTAIVEFTKTEAALADLRARHANVVFAVDTTKGLADAKAARAEVRGYRTALENERVAVKANALKRCRDIDSEAKRITAALEALEEPIDAQIKTAEAKKEAERQAKIDAEVQRVEGIQKRLSEIRATAQSVPLMGPTASAKIAELIAGLEAVVIDESFAEFQQQASDAKLATLATIRQFHAAAVEREAEAERVKIERAELAKLRADQAERDAADRRKREAEEATARAAREEEDRKARAAREEEERIEREQLAEQRRQQQEAQAKIDAGSARIAAESRKLKAAQDEQLRKEQEAERQRLAAVEDERKRKDAAERALKRAKFPGEQAIVDVLAEHYEVKPEVVMKWLTELRKAA